MKDPTLNPLNEFLKDNGIWLAIGLACIILIALLLTFLLPSFLARRRKKKTKAASNIALDDEKKSLRWVNALGGKDNIIERELKGSRIVLTLKDPGLIRKEELSELGVRSIMEEKKKTTLVIENDAETVFRLLA